MTSYHDEWEKKLEDSNAEPMSLPLQFLKDITCDFSTESELGRGGFGVVYKGVLHSGKIIAVKKLSEINLIDDKTFQKEVSFLKAMKHHHHVVQFIGYCAESSWEVIDQPNGRSIWAETPKRLLCFTYVCNRSLDSHISDESSVLAWNIRYDIIKGICSGLNFLHEECRIVHLDLKPENILMDVTMIPKITDFGVSRIFGDKQSRIITANCVGSRGYMAPEYINRGIISMKADIFSLGVIILEIITGRRDYPDFQFDSPLSIITSCQRFMEEVLGSWRHEFKYIEKYKSTEIYNQQVKQCVAIALKCVNPDMVKRPTVLDIIQELNALDQMAANDESPSEMECKGKSLVIDTTLSNDIILHSIIEEMSNTEADGIVRGVKQSQECSSPTLSWKSTTSSLDHEEEAEESSRSEQVIDDGKVVAETASESSTYNQNYQERVKESNKPQLSIDTTTEVIASSGEHLDVHPLELNFPIEPNKLITCSLHLTNKNDKQVVFRLMEKRYNWMCFLKLPLYGIVPPRSTYTLVVTTGKKESLPKERTVDLILQSSVSDEYVMPFKRGYDCDQYFEKAKKLENAVHTIALKAIYAHNGKTYEEVLSPTPLWTSSTEPGDHEEAAKKSSEQHEASIKTSEVVPGSRVLLDVHPLELLFRFEPNKLIACSLDLTNNTDEQVAFGLLKMSDEKTCFLSRLPMFGIVDPMSTYTLVVKMDKYRNLPQERNVDLILQTSTYCEVLCDEDMCMQHFQIAEELGYTVHKMTLKGVCALQGDRIFEESIPPSIKIISVEDNHDLLGYGIYSMDANQTEPLIITGHSYGHIHIWNYDTQKSMGFIEMANKATVRSVKFIARKGWFLVGCTDGYIHVYNYKKKMERITSFKVHDVGSVESLAIHPTYPYVLSASDRQIKLWDYVTGWDCRQTFKEHSIGVCAVAFNPEDCGSFASASIDGTIQVWSIHSPKSKYTLSGHSGAVVSLDFFTRDGQQYLITGSCDMTAKIWDMQKKECIHTLPHRSSVLSVLPHPKLQFLVTGTDDGHVHFWRSSNFRLKRKLHIDGHTWVKSLACLIESKRVVVSQERVFSVVEIHDEEEQGGSSNKSSTSAMD